MGKITDFNYDENFRRFVVHQGVEMGGVEMGSCLNI